MIYQKKFTPRQLIPEFSSRLYQSLYDCVRRLRLGKIFAENRRASPFNKRGWALGGIKIWDRENEGKRGKYPRRFMRVNSLLGTG
jgi:hypothetical protein